MGFVTSAQLKSVQQKLVNDLKEGELKPALSKQTEGIATNRIIEDIDVACPPIVFGTTGGDAEIQTGYNKFRNLFGLSKKWNQKFGLTSNQFSIIRSTSISNSGTEITLTSSTDSNTVKDACIKLIYNHKYYISGSVKCGTATNAYLQIYAYTGGGNLQVVISNTTTTYASNAMIYTAGDSDTAVGIRLPSSEGSGKTMIAKNVMCIDLTALYGAGNEPTTVAAFKADYPLDYYAYNPGTILSSKSYALKSTGRNQWDESNFIRCNLDGSYNIVPASDGTRMASDYIEVLPETTYFWSAPCITPMMYYDANKNLVSYESVQKDATFTIPSNCYYIRFAVLITNYGGTTYNNDICIYINWDTPGLPYEAYREDRVELPNIELRSVPNYTSGGEIRDEAYQAGGGKRKVGVYTFTGSEEIGAWDTERYYFQGIKSLVKAPSGVAIANIAICGLEAKQLDNMGTSGIAAYAQSSSYPQYSGIIFFKDPSITSVAACKSFLTGKTLLYELKEETDIPTTENPGWRELVYTDNYGTLEFLTDPNAPQVPQTEQPYYIEYTISLTDFLDSVYTHASGVAENLALQEDVDKIIGGTTEVGKAKLADNLESNIKITNIDPYLFRQSPTGVADSMILEDIEGATVDWNGKVENGDFSDGDSKWTVYMSSRATLSVNSGIATMMLLTASTIGNKYEYGLKQSNATSSNFRLTANHKYFVSAQVKSSFASDYKIEINSNKSYTKSIPANTWTNISAILGITNVVEHSTMIFPYGTWSATATYQVQNYMLIDLTQMFGVGIADYLYNQGDNGVTLFRSWFPKSYYDYNDGKLVSVRTNGRMTRGINQWDEITELGYIDSTGNKPSSSNLRSKNYIKVIPGGAYYFKIPNSGNVFNIIQYDADKNYILTSYPTSNTTATLNAKTHFIRFYLEGTYGTTYKNDICINVSDPSINGTYFPYESNTYPIEPTELNGFFKLDSSNNLYCDGDVYKNDGTITRRYGSVDLGTLNWTYWNSTYGFYTEGINSLIKLAGHSSGSRIPMICSKYGHSVTFDELTGANRCVAFYHSDADRLCIKDSSAGTDPAAFKTAMSGVYLIYELKTTTTETASTFASTQATGITEEFLEPEYLDGELAIMLPVGHNSNYLPDLKAKLEDSPENPIADGLYLVSRTGGVNTYISFDSTLATQEEIDEIIEILQ